MKEYDENMGYEFDEMASDILEEVRDGSYHVRIDDEEAVVTVEYDENTDVRTSKFRPYVDECDNDEEVIHIVCTKAPDDCLIYIIQKGTVKCSGMVEINKTVRHDIECLSRIVGAYLAAA